MYENYIYKYKSRGKFVFLPTPECNRKADYLIKFGKTLEIPNYFFHYRPGGHVEALHRHIESTYFFRIDLKNFFYSISRNRVSRLLRQSGFPKSARTYAEWSTVRNPHVDGPKYVLPIGFKQSPLLASLALYRSAVASAVEHAAHCGVFVSVYFDDLIGSCNDRGKLRVTYNGILSAFIQANLIVNNNKLIEPAEAIIAFNCHLTRGRAAVTDERMQEFSDESRGPVAETAFLDYCIRVERKNFI